MVGTISYGRVILWDQRVDARYVQVSDCGKLITFRHCIKYLLCAIFGQNEFDIDSY